MEKPIVRKMKNGFIVCLVPHRGVESVTLHLRGRAGSNYEKNDEVGAAHITEHLVVEYPLKKEVIKRGGKIVAVTSRDEVLIMVKVLKKDLSYALRYLKQVLKVASFEKESFDTQKNIAIQEIRRFMNVPEKLISRISYKLLYPGQRIENFNTGSEEDLKKLSLENVISFKRRCYVPNNFSLTVCGDLKSKVVLKKVFDEFKEFSPGAKNSIKLIPEKKGKEQIIVSPYFTQSHIKIDYYDVKSDGAKRFDSLLSAKTLDNYLKNNLKAKLGLAYNVSASLYSSLNYGIFSIYCAVDHKNLLEVTKFLLTLKNRTTEIIDKDSFEIAKKELIADLIFSHDKTSSRADFYSQVTLTSNTAHTFSKEISLIKSVTIKKCLKRLKKILTQDPKVTVLTNKSAKGK